ncbi:DUF2949 domain-containing protein [Microcystis sp. LE19-195.1E]|uniref:DUF2949 domain-containing protein n=1 Tax=Microcystis sp. LE19-195.1E TaxID=3016440 RepID=UPI0022C62E1E|nr:DUF2949 domain-containing protein [Microcystis sp. LE19-195.1E]MCZ8248066.1 DUF2949 domain-containing protein [Microcystis sp. LE19-195.1E]
MEAHQQKQLRTFLLEKLAISPRSLDMDLRLCEASVGSLPMVLWQYGLIDLSQLNQVFDWMETV